MATALAAASTLAGASVATTASAQSGSYQQSCRNISSSGGSLSAECADSQGRYRSSAIAASQCQGDIGNNNGMLVCNGATASGGAYVAEPARPQDNNRGNRGNNDYRGDNNYRGNDRDRDRGVSTSTAVGVGILGALLGGNLYQNNVQYPTYGQRGYGDPRYDPRYAQGGWGYGYQAGQYVPISRRAEWLDRRIDQGERRGRLSRREAMTLRNQLQDIVQMERDYGRNGFTNYERADLDRRFDYLAARIRFERSDYDNRSGYNNGGYNNGGYNSGGYNRGY